MCVFGYSNCLHIDNGTTYCLINNITYLSLFSSETSFLKNNLIEISAIDLKTLTEIYSDFFTTNEFGFINFSGYSGFNVTFSSLFLQSFRKTYIFIFSIGLLLSSSKSYASTSSSASIK